MLSNELNTTPSPSNDRDMGKGKNRMFMCIKLKTNLFHLLKRVFERIINPLINGKHEK